MSNLFSRIKGKYRRTSANRFCRRMVDIKSPVPIISFTFDDAPRTAFITGSSILKTYGARATFFVSLGLLGRQTEVGAIASADDLRHVLAEGHELGCHTFDHLDAWKTPTEKFVESVEENKRVLSRILPGVEFKTLSYPISEPRPTTKYQVEKRFCCCRGGGQTFNVGMVDLNLLKAYFLDRRNNADIEQIKRLIDHSTSCRGWLIFATHDVTDDPSPYGCTPQFLRAVVEHAACSGALLLPLKEACEELQTSNLEHVTQERDTL